MSYPLFIDDERDPPADRQQWRIGRNLREVALIIKELGPPNFISFDHDLGENEPTGYDIAKKLVAGDLGELAGNDFERGLPTDFSFYVHSQNPVGAENIRTLLVNYLTFRNREG
ncbi:cyclic-phosphate processing receiver domain-containing protein [Sulfitobacter pontiacus]|uniref:cyclic-phosphate processing receiver domain-containing protein n=1 Tax=Sulfitobacter pontiacus TaxID=60137 RepID=UPI000447C398|nr:cyclic-phosphate processing receiver domain-containing protein [Sulfitobacter pontiacus]KAJ31750.1 hypothetical protein PM01_01000 [Sulfitobacter pontiacus 3SOLIMAR09]